MLSLILSVSAHAIFPAEPFTAFDNEYLQRRNFNRFQLALNGYREQVEKTPDSVEANWRLAMACTYLGLRVEKDESKIKEAFNEGREAALKAVTKAPDCVSCHFWRAVNQVLYANKVGVIKMLFTVKEVRNHFRFVAEKEPGFLDGGALRFLAIIDWKVPGILGGDNDRARESFELALKHGPNEPMNYEFYHAFLEDRGDGADALALLKRVLLIEEPDANLIESHDSWEKLVAQAKKSQGSIVAAK